MNENRMGGIIALVNLLYLAGLGIAFSIDAISGDALMICVGIFLLVVAVNKV